MAASGGHVVWHVLCRRDKVSDIMLAFGFNAKHEFKTTCLLIAACYNVYITHIQLAWS